MSLCRPLARSAWARFIVPSSRAVAAPRGWPRSFGACAKQPEADGGDWSSFSVEQWRSAAYGAKSFFAQLSEDTTDFIGSLCDELGGTGEEGPVVVEVGCGTGEALLPLVTTANGAKPRCRHAAGVDFNPNFVDFCRGDVPVQDRHRVKHLVGDAQHLVSLCIEKLPAEWQIQRRPKVVTCVGNTIGIVPDEIRPKVYQQMMELAGPNGYFVVVYWNGNRFGDAVQNFYHKNPQLCGDFTGDCVDLDTCTLTTPSGYRTKWTKPEEAREIFEKQIGAQVMKLQEVGNGVLVAGRAPSC